MKQENTGWQPIETAPKDGTEILITNGSEREVGRWGTVFCTISTRCGWIYGRGDCDSNYDEMEDVTHYADLLPLPDKQP